MSSPLRILQLNNRIPYPLNDGGNIATWYVASFLKKNGHTVDIAYLNTNKHYGVASDIQNTYRNIFFTDINTDLSFMGLLKGFFSKTPYNVSRFRNVDFEALLKKVLTEQTYDIIQVEGSYMALYLPVIKKYKQTAKVVLRSHNIEHAIWKRLSENESNPIKKIYLKTLYPKIRRFENETMEGFDAIVAITTEDETYYRSSGFNGLLTTIQAGFDDAARIDEASKTPYTICFIGSMEWMPNVEGLAWFLKEVWPLIHDEMPEAEFHIAGKGMGQSFSHWKSPGVFLHGMVPDAAEFIQKHRVFVVPLLSGGGMRLKVVEAMGLNMPVVSTGIGAEGINAVPGEDLLIADQALEMKKQIILLLKDDQKAAYIAANARKKAIEKYSWNTLISMFEKLYEKLR